MRSEPLSTSTLGFESRMYSADRLSASPSELFVSTRYTPSTSARCENDSRSSDVDSMRESAKSDPVSISADVAP